MRKQKQPWPTKDAMEQVYEKQLWGTNGADFYSGEGSHHQLIVNPYIKEVSSFLSSFNTPLVVCDLGCGDFNVGSQLVKFTKQYIAVDIVESLINRNKQMFKSVNLEFQCLDIAKNDLPKADCILLRQVLQHLSNSEIKAVINKLSSYKYVIVTEHIPEGDFIPNKDIISGQGIRLKKNSGVNLLAEPFRLKVKSSKDLLTSKPLKGKGKIVTTLFQMN